MTSYLTLHNDDETAPERAGYWITSLCQQAGLPEALNHQVASCVVEAVNNAMAGKSEQKKTKIRLKSHTRQDCLVICIRDTGPSAEGKLTTDLPEADSFGGRGWFIINSWMDIARYKRCGPHNVVSMVKQLPKVHVTVADERPNAQH